jgi:hypothetical protein
LSTFKKVAIAVVALVVAIVTLGIMGLASGTSEGAASSAVQIKSEGERQRGGGALEVRSREESIDFFCRRLRDARGDEGRCEKVAVLKTTDRYRPCLSCRGSAELRAQLRADRVRGSGIWCKDWWTQMRGLYYFNWSEKMTGTFCWYEEPAAPKIFQNTQHCGDSSGIGYDVEVLECDKEKRYGDTQWGWWMRDYDQYRVSAIARGVPMHDTKLMWTNLHPSGNITFYYD